MIQLDKLLFVMVLDNNILLYMINYYLIQLGNKIQLNIKFDLSYHY